MTVPDVDCPDCGGPMFRPPGNTTPHHADTCPWSLGLDAVTDRDRAWFDSHPGADSYWRPITPPEQAEWLGVRGLPVVDAPFRVEGRVQVTLLESGLRCRSFDAVWLRVLDGAP